MSSITALIRALSEGIVATSVFLTALHATGALERIWPEEQFLAPISRPAPGFSGEPAEPDWLLVAFWVAVAIVAAGAAAYVVHKLWGRVA